MLNLPISEGIELVKKAYEKREEEKAWQMWLTLYPYMNKENFMPFTDFYKRQIEPISTRPTEEILQEVYTIREKMKGSVTTSKT